METEELGTDVLEGSQFHWLLWVTVRNLRRVETSPGLVKKSIGRSSISIHEHSLAFAFAAAVASSWQRTKRARRRNCQ
jgi:hypothetical protein